jgi:hypothetical protein
MGAVSYLKSSEKEEGNLRGRERKSKNVIL